MSSELKDTSLEILKMLKDNKQKYVSGEDLSNLLGISRTAVWKRIDALKKEGFDIEASTKLGYSLGNKEDPYGRLAVQSAVKTSMIGKNLSFLSEIDSTNTELKRMAANDASEGTVVLSEAQTAGRGRRGRSWMSDPGLGIWMSVLLRPLIHPSQVQTITLAASIAVVRALEKHGINGLGIKWPNDILINGKKVCGILTELSAEADRTEWVVLGIGLNVNHQQEDFPDDLKPSATSLKLSFGESGHFIRSQIASDIINELEDVYLSFLQKGPAWVAQEWKKHNVTLGKRVNLITANETLQVDVLDITKDGQLIVKYDDGTTGTILSGEISLRAATTE